MAKLTQRLGLPRFEADEYYKQALTIFPKGQYDQAIDRIDKAIEILPRSEYYATRGFFYLQDDVPDKAKADFEQALKIYRFEMLAHYGLGVLAYKNRKYEEAINHFNSAIAAEPERGELLYYLALSYHRMRNNATALQWMQKAAGAFDKTGDKRKGDAVKWVKEFEKLIPS
jgi:tetratricopeptide (TPR) repeat protein